MSPSVPVGSRSPLAGARSLLRWVCTSNPFYVLSAGLFLIGVTTKSWSRAASVRIWTPMPVKRPCTSWSDLPNLSRRIQPADEPAALAEPAAKASNQSERGSSYSHRFPQAERTVRTPARAPVRPEPFPSLREIGLNPALIRRPEAEGELPRMFGA
jgi:hypothetical protein